MFKFETGKHKTQQISPAIKVQVSEIPGGHMVEKMEAVGDPLLLVFEFCCAAIGPGLGDIGKEICVITGFDAQDKTQFVAFQLLNVGRIRTQGIFYNNQG